MDLNLRPFLSGALPVMTDSIRDLVFMIDEGKSMDEIYNAVCESHMAQSVADPNGWIGGQRLRVLFHTLSRELLRSLLMKTLGPDLWKEGPENENWKRVFPSSGAGCYVCFIYIHGRRGKFLSSNEIRQVISELEIYERVVNAYQEHHEGPDALFDQSFTEEQKEEYDRAMEIDDVLRLEERWDLDNPEYNLFVPRFMGSPTRSGAKRSGNISALIDMLKRRCEYTTDPNTHHRQSPLLVGNSNNVARRVQSHLIPSSFSNSPKVWGLLLSCMKVLGFECRTGYATLFRTWKDEAQINQAEVLGTILAGSMISEDGLNVKEPGTRIDSGPWTPNNYGDARDLVCANTPWFRENLRQSAASIPPTKLDELREEMAKNDDILKGGAVALREKKTELDAAKARYEEAKATAEANRAEGEKMLKEMEELFEEGEDLTPSRWSTL